MTTQEIDEMISVMRECYKNSKDQDLRFAMKALGNFLKSKRTAAESLDDDTVAYLRKRYQTLRS
jgi:hypothetical protein